MFTAYTQAFLHRGRSLVAPFLKPQEYILKLIHPGICKQDGGIILRKEEGTFDYFMFFFGEEI
jgi:hypothetical protein